MSPRTLWFVALAPLLLAGCPGGGGGDGPGVTCAAVTSPARTATLPRDVLDLSHWSLTLPVDAAGNHSGTAATITTNELLAGYESDWFHAVEGAGVEFFAPIQGATTKSTIYPRSELRELLSPPDPSINWSSAGPAELVADLAVHQVPLANGKVTVGEIVGYNGENPDINVLTKLVFEYNAENCAATLYTLTLPSPTASGSTASRQILTRTLNLGQRFSYSIRVDNKTLYFTAGGATASEPITADWNAVGLYFRAGASLFANGTSLTDGARVTFYQLDVTH